MIMRRKISLTSDQKVRALVSASVMVTRWNFMIWIRSIIIMLLISRLTTATTSTLMITRMLIVDLCRSSSGK